MGRTAKVFRSGQEQAQCEYCRKPFVKLIRKQRFCSKVCKARAFNEETQLAVEHYRNCPNVRRAKR